MSQEPDETLDQLDEAAFLNSILKAIRGYGKDDIEKKVSTMSKEQLNAIVSMAQPKSARRTLSPKDYMLWNAANERLGVNEEADLQELSTDTIKNYKRKASLDFVKNDKPDAEMQKRAMKRRKGIDMSLKRLRPVKESEEIQELSKKTLGSYVKKATRDVSKRSRDDGFDVGRNGIKQGMNKRNIKNWRREIGIDMALDKMTKEELEHLDEKAASKSQQKFMAMALAYKRGELDGPASPEIKSLAAKMSEKDLEDFAKTKHKGLPDKVEEAKIDYLGKLARTATPKNPTKKNMDHIAALAKSKKAKEKLKGLVKTEATLSQVKGMVSKGSTNYSLADVKKAVRLADRYANNMTKATQEIEKIAKGLSGHPTVKRELRTVNEHSRFQVNEATVKTMDGDVLKVGDFAGFKDDIEQSGKVVKIQGNTVTLSIYDSDTGDRHQRNFLGRELWKE